MAGTVLYQRLVQAAPPPVVAKAITPVAVTPAAAAPAAATPAAAAVPAAAPPKPESVWFKPWTWF